MGENDRKMQKTFIEERQWKTNLDFWLIQLEICKIVAASTLRAGVQYPPCTQIGSGNSSDGTLANTLMKPLHSRHGHFLAHDPL